MVALKWLDDQWLVKQQIIKLEDFTYWLSIICWKCKTLSLSISVFHVWEKPLDSSDFYELQKFRWNSVRNSELAGDFSHKSLHIVHVDVFLCCGWQLCCRGPFQATPPLQLWLAAQHGAGTDALQCLRATLLKLFTCFPAWVTDTDLWLRLEVFVVENKLWSWMINSAISGKNEESKTAKFSSAS